VMVRSHEPASPARILVVDDEPNIRDLVATTLRYEGFDVQVAGAGRSALTAVRKVGADLVILDLMLPDLDGFEVHRRLSNEGYRVPVLFLTARDTTEDKVRGLTMGADDYVTKPFSLEELVARVRAILRRTGRGGTWRSPRRSRMHTVEASPWSPATGAPGFA
jgi:two-component system, OmpR family, response regulator